MIGHGPGSRGFLPRQFHLLGVDITNRDYIHLVRLQKLPQHVPAAVARADKSQAEPVVSPHDPRIRYRGQGGCRLYGSPQQFSASHQVF